MSDLTSRVRVAPLFVSFGAFASLSSPNPGIGRVVPGRRYTPA